MLFFFIQYKIHKLFKIAIWPIMGFPGGSAVNNLLAMQERKETLVRSLCQEDPLKEEMATMPVSLLRKSHGQRSLAGYVPCDHKELDTTE